MSVARHQHRFILSLLGLLAGSEVSAQNPSNWRVYKASDGLAESACISVTCSSFGRVLVRHYNLPFISELDGYTPRRIPAPDMRPGRVYGGSSDQVWTVSSRGLWEYREARWWPHELPEISNLFATRNPRSTDPAPLYPLRRHAVLCLLPNRLVQYNFEQEEAPGCTVLRESAGGPLREFINLSPARDGGIWLSGESGLSKLSGLARNVSTNSTWTDYPVPAGLGVVGLQAPREDELGRVVMTADATNGERAIVVFDAGAWMTRLGGSERLRSAWIGPDGHLWATTIVALKRAETLKSELLNAEQVSARQFLDVAVEPGGSFWLATSDGLIRYALLPWRVPPQLQEVRSSARGLTADDAGLIWFVSSSGLHSFDGAVLRTRELDAGLADRVRRCQALPGGHVYLETDTQILSFSAEGGRPVVVAQANPGETLGLLGKLEDGGLCVYRASAKVGSRSYQFATLEGVTLRESSWPRLELGENLTTLSQTRRNGLWIAGDGGLVHLRENRWMAAKLPAAGSGPVNHLLETVDGQLWCATRESVWHYVGNDWAMVRAGFDQVNAMLRAQDGSIWVGSNSGLFRHLRGLWMECGTEEGLPDSSVRHLVEDAQGNVYAATARGLARYFPEADLDPPRTSLRRVPGWTDESRNSMTMTFSGQDKWKQTPRERLLYSHRLDEQDWSAFSESTEILVDDLSAGKHVFQVRAMDRNFNLETDPARLEFNIVLPWYQEPRIVVSALLGTLSALFFAGLAVNRHRQLLRSYELVERKVAERTRDLEHASMQLLHSQKMTALGTLAAGVAHDFNNILSVIKGSAQIIEENLDKPDKVRARLGRIKTVVDQGAETIRAMLGFSRESDAQPAACDIRAVAEDTVRLLGERLVRQAPVKLKFTEDLPPVRASRDLIQQILFNFVFNAAESQTGAKGILISVRLLPEPPAGMMLTPAAAGACVAVSVRDWGAGISPENLPRIFEPFFTTKAMSARRGTGLGLSMVYELARKMGAGLAVESIPGEGSTFTLLLPLNTSPEVAAAPTSRAQPPAT